MSKRYEEALETDLHNLLIAALVDSGLEPQHVREVLNRLASKLKTDMTSLLRRHVGSVGGEIIVDVVVNRELVLTDALAATGCVLYAGTRDSVPKVLNAGSDKIKIHLFQILRGGFIRGDDLAIEYALRDLEPADPFALAALNATDKMFSAAHNNCTQWRGVNHKWCDLSFYTLRGKRMMRIGYGQGYDDSWWFAGVKKKKSR